MQAGFIPVCFSFLIVLNGCCMRNVPTQTATFQQETTRWYYRAVAGEKFMIPCNGYAEMEWFRVGDQSGRNEPQSIHCDKEFVVEARHSGNYTCVTRSRILFLHLQVVEVSLGCSSKEKEVVLIGNKPGEILCPGYNCTNGTYATWFKGKNNMTVQRRGLHMNNGLLHLCEVKPEYDHGLYFCDRQIIEPGVTWTFRRAVWATILPREQATDPPRITYPLANNTEKVELGHSHTLTCEIDFPTERIIAAEVQWYMNYGGDEKNMVLLHTEKPKNGTRTYDYFIVTMRTIIKEVTPQHLGHTYTCIASNMVGKSNVTIKLEEKMKAKWLSLVEYPIGPLLLLAGVAITLHLKWLEINLIYRAHFQPRKYEEDEKDFDVFLSYVWSPSPRMGESWTSLSSSGAGPDKEADSSIMDPLNPKEGEAPQSQLEEFLPQLLEEHWGYRVCLLQRDILPGGVYTNDVILAIQRSKMLICLLSAEYLSNSNACFVLEAGVQALLQNSAFKLLLIRISRDLTSPVLQDPQLSTLVQRALKVLPTLNWTSGNSDNGTCNFLKSLRKALPNQSDAESLR
ncbi:interleukin-18 receptor accessory protein-like isoform X1 [Echeneis naucrates]|uniref:interleukin-18 receptor accessory protein-like isoform X1 n=1 Tax=Echeneis naucrates TaxID=173247 RepID=UPI0011134309|nr:interleukin-18 receptor accessory protein-like isoform X1 [Echeneis naucrates]